MVCVARIVFVVVNSSVKIRSCTLCSETCHLTNLCLSHTMHKHYFDFDQLLITFQPSRNVGLCHFPILNEEYRVPQRRWFEKYHSI